MSQSKRKPSRAGVGRTGASLGRAGLLAGLAPLVVPALGQLHSIASDPVWLPEPSRELLVLLVAGLQLVAALVLARKPRAGRAALITGSVGFGVMVVLELRAQPTLAMMMLIAIVVSCAWIYASPEVLEAGPALPDPRRARRAHARMSALGTVSAGLLAVGFRMADAPGLRASLAVSLSLSLALCAQAEWRGVKRERAADPSRSRAARAGARTPILVGIGLASAAAFALLGFAERPQLAALAVASAALALAMVTRRAMSRGPFERQAGFQELLLEQPARLLVGSFLLAAVFGGVLLSLPNSSTQGPATLIDATFTAFSAVCVTGLAVLDTGADYSLLGQAIILLLIQLGGLGIMSFSTAAMVLLGQRLSLKHEGAVSQLLGGRGSADLRSALRQIFVVTGACELLGTVALTLTFRAHGDGWAMAAWRGLFTSISAYCNAGFALQSDSLVAYQSSPLVLHVVGALIILGSLGPAVVAALLLLGRRRVELHARIVLSSTVALLFIPFVLLAVLEWNQAFAGLSPVDRLHNAWFQSLTTRTAGFNSVDFAAMAPASQTLVELLMFIGGSPGSTAGGIKTTTVFVMLVAIGAVARGREVVVWGGWTLPQRTVYRAAAVSALGAASVVVAVFALQLTQRMDSPVAVFEAISALSTVGLSTGGTAALDSVGKLIVIACMFVGRVAPLTLFLLFSRSSRPEQGWSFPEQDLSVG